MTILLDVMSVALWAGVAVYVPAVFYLMIVNPPLYRAEQIKEQQIYIVHMEPVWEKRRQARSTIIIFMYIACCLLFGSIYAVNLQSSVPGLFPVNILVSFYNIVFGFAVLTYMPVALYLFLKNPLQYKEEGLELNGLFFAYGLVILLFSLAYAAHWLKQVRVDVSWIKVIQSLGIVTFSSLAMSYLPILTYVLLEHSNPYRMHKVRLNLMIVIYGLSFLLFSGLYGYGWYTQWAAGVVK